MGVSSQQPSAGLGQSIVNWLNQGVQQHLPQDWSMQRASYGAGQASLPHEVPSVEQGMGVGKGVALGIGPLAIESPKIIEMARWKAANKPLTAEEAASQDAMNTFNALYDESVKMMEPQITKRYYVATDPDKYGLPDLWFNTEREAQGFVRRNPSAEIYLQEEGKEGLRYIPRSQLR